MYRFLSPLPQYFQFYFYVEQALYFLLLHTSFLLVYSSPHELLSQVLIVSFQYQFLWYYLYVLLTIQQSLNGDVLNLFLFLPIFDSICILQNEKLFPKKITFFQLNISAILLYLKLFVAVLCVISSSLCKSFHFIFVRYFIYLSWT